MRNSVDYKDLTCISNKRRTEFLRDYRERIVEYFSNVSHSWQADSSIENDTASEIRPELNENMQSAQRFVRGAGIPVDATQMPAPAIGGRPIPFDFISDMFRLRDFQTTEAPLLDRIDRAIGVYEADRTNALVRTLNPAWWIWRAFIVLLKLPFLVLQASGFDSRKLEDTLVGRLLKFLVFLLTAGASLVAIVEFFKD